MVDAIIARVAGGRCVGLLYVLSGNTSYAHGGGVQRPFHVISLGCSFLNNGDSR